MKLSKRKKYDEKFSEYPCVDYLRNALFFIREGKPNTAYSEILNALQKAGVTLDTEEIDWRKSSDEE